MSGKESMATANVIALFEQREREKKGRVFWAGKFAVNESEKGLIKLLFN